MESKYNKMKTIQTLKVLAATAALVALVGCAGQPGQLALGSGTTVGFDVSANPAASGTPQATLAYKRVEFATAPVGTNGIAPDMIMEFSLHTSLFTSAGGIYSRIATGPNATVSAPAALLFSKGMGKVAGQSPGTVQVLLPPVKQPVRPSN